MVAKSFKDLIVWNKSRDITVNIYSAFKLSKDRSFTDQIQRASVSIMNNIAEGYAKHSDKAFKNYLSISKGSAAEVESMLHLVLDLRYISQTVHEKLFTQTNEVSKLLTGFMKKL